MYVSTHVKAEFSRAVIGDRVECKLAQSQRNAIRHNRVYLSQPSFSIQTGTSRGKLLPRNSLGLELFLSFEVAGTDD